MNSPDPDGFKTEFYLTCKGDLHPNLINLLNRKKIGRTTCNYSYLYLTKMLKAYTGKMTPSRLPY